MAQIPLKPAVKRTRTPSPSFVVIVQKTELTKQVFGPYRSFKRAEGDAKAWDGTVEPLTAVFR